MHNRARRIVVAGAGALFAACSTAPRSPVPPSPVWGEAGRIIGGRAATVALAEACAVAYPALAPDLGRALADWRWRNDALAIEVEDAMWRSTAARGASDASIAAARRELAREVEASAAEIFGQFDAWPGARRARYCQGLGERLLSGDEDLARRYPAELRTWHPAAP